MGKEGLLAYQMESDRFDNLIGENAVLARELAAAQQRSTQQAIEHARRVDSQQREIMRLRSQLIGRDTMIAALHEDLRVLEAPAQSGVL